MDTPSEPADALQSAFPAEDPAHDLPPRPDAGAAEAPPPTYHCALVAGVPQYQCLACAHQTTDLDALCTHLREDHHLTPAPEMPDVSLTRTDTAAFPPAPTYIVSTWHGHPQYHCLACGYAHMTSDVLVRHLRETHGCAATTAAPDEAEADQDAAPPPEAARTASDVRPEDLGADEFAPQPLLEEGR